jgi:hypothetical protein
VTEHAARQAPRHFEFTGDGSCPFAMRPRVIEDAGAQLAFLPPYSPDLNPIELAWAKVKHLLRTWAARTWPLLVMPLPTQ